MRAFIIAATLIPFFASTAALADGAATPAKVTYTTADTDIGTILDDAALRAIVDKHIPGFTSGDQVDMARPMTLRAIQQFAPDMITDQVLSEIDAEFAKVAAVKK